MPYALQCGLAYDEYWEMSPYEQKLYFEAYAAKEKRKAEEIALTTYNIAKMTATFVGSVFNGKPVPAYDTLFPQTSTSSSTSGKPVDEKMEAMKVTAYMMDFAMKHNAQRHKKLERVGEVK